MSGETADGLRRDAIGLREVLFQSLTAMAPAAAVAASVHLDEPPSLGLPQSGAVRR